VTRAFFRARGTALAFVAAVVLGPRGAGASPDALRGFGPRSGALAAANVADLDDASAVLQNPSGLVRASGTTLSLAYDRQASSLEGDGVAAPFLPIDTLELGIVVPGSLAGFPVAFGLALALPDGRLSRLGQVEPTTRYFPLDDAGPRLVDLGVALAVSPFEGLEVGGGVGFVASLSGGFDVAGTVVPRDANGAEYDSALVHGVDAELGTSRYPLLGAAYQPLSGLRLAAAFRGAARVRQRIRGLLDGELSFGGVGFPVEYEFTSDAVVAYTPAELAFGASVRPLPSLAVHAALAWQRYSRYPSPYTTTATRLRTELSPFLDLPPDDPGTPPPPAHFRDRFVPRLGVERPFALGADASLTARAGYAYEHSPVPAAQQNTLFFDLDRHAVSLGAGLALERPLDPFRQLRLDLDLELVHGVPRRFETTGPLGTAQHRVRGDLFSFGAALGLVFGEGPG
jgi:long-subunit fatty acid transport protein